MPSYLLFGHPSGAYLAGLGQLIIIIWIICAVLLLVPIVDLIAWRWRWLGWVDLVLTVLAWGFGILVTVVAGALVLFYVPYWVLQTLLFGLAWWRRRRRYAREAREVSEG